MMDCISVENMRQSDACTIANYVPSLELMNRAAFGVFKAVDWKGNVAIVAGSGNNGGDGFALACILNEHRIPCTVFTLSQRLSDDSAHYAGKARASGIAVKPFAEGCLVGFSVVVDCLLGTGFRSELREQYRNAIRQINDSGAYVVSVDINSGMNGDTGEAELAVISDLTVTIGYVKIGMVGENAGKWMKRLVCADIGIILCKEEWKIGDGSDQLPCPPWLDTEIIKAY